MSRLLRHLICISCVVSHLNGEICTETKRRVKLLNFDATRRNSLFVTNESCSINYFDVSIVNDATLNVIHSSENLRSLDLSNNRINEIQNETFTNFASLEILRLHNNFMTEVHDQHFKYLKELTGLDLSSNLIGVINFNAFEKLQNLLWVNIADNCLHNVALYFPLRALHSLNIAHNQINRFPQLSGISAITNLNLSHNLIVDLQLTKALIKSIQSLNIADNQLKDPNQLIEFSDLIELNLADNTNTDYTTNDKFIRHLAGLRKLNLINTNLKSLDIFLYMSGTNFIELSLSKNPLVTDFKELSKFSNLVSLEFQQKFCHDFDYRTISLAFRNLKIVKILYDDNSSCKCLRWNRMQFEFEGIDYQTDWSICENDPDCGQSIKFNIVAMTVVFILIIKIMNFMF